MSWDQLREKLSKLGPEVSDEYPFLNVRDTRALLADCDHLAYLLAIKKGNPAIKSITKEPDGSTTFTMKGANYCTQCGSNADLNSAGWCFNCFSAASR